MAMLRNTIYYNLKPFVPDTLRMALRRRFARRQRTRARSSWPIKPGSEQPPPGWSGWLKGKKFALVLTHDVEGSAGLAKCRQLMQLEQELGFRSSFGFIPEGPYHTPPALREELVQNGFEIGVHDLHHNGQLYRNRRDFLKKAARINHYLAEWQAVGFRSGFMLRNLNWLHELGIQYDMSTFDTDPFEPQPDGRDTIFPFFIPHLGKAGQGSASGLNGYVELPYTLPQDSTLFLLLGETTPEIWFRKLDWVAAHGGMVLLDTHPDYMAFDGAKPSRLEYPVTLYQQLLEYIRSNYAGEYWHALPKEMASYTLSQLVVKEAHADASLPITESESPVSDSSFLVHSDEQSRDS